MGSAVLSYAGCDENYYCNDQSYFQLDACSLCQKPLGHNCDIYMYRGNTPFCSQECRQEQIDIDEASEKSWKRLSSNSKNALKKTPNDSNNKQSTPNKAVRRGILTVA